MFGGTQRRQKKRTTEHKNMQDTQNPTEFEFDGDFHIAQRYTARALYCIVLYLLPVLNPKSYDGARVLYCIVFAARTEP